MTTGATTGDGITIRLLDAHEGVMVVDAIRSVYGDSYDVDWCYDSEEVGRRIAHGHVVSAAAFDADGALLCHAALTRHGHDDEVVHSGQAVSLPAARGHHLFTRVKQYLADWSLQRGILGIYSEATAAHPYSQKANLDLGATETGVLLAWIPDTVDNDASVLSEPTRASVVLFYLLTNHAPAHPVYAPPAHREMVRTIVDHAGLRGGMAHAPKRFSPDAHTTAHTVVDATHNSAIVHVRRVGDDLAAVLAADRARLFDRGVDVVYADLPLDQPATELVADEVRDAGFGFAGVFPSTRHAGEVLRVQALRPGLRVSPHDVSVASDHGRSLLDYVLADTPGVVDDAGGAASMSP